MVFFAGGNYLLSPYSLPATEENINIAIQAIDNKVGGGGTQLLPALQTALNLEGNEDFARTFVIATDGYVSVEKAAFDLIRENLNEANFFAFGIGSSVNRYIIEGIANVGMGEPFVVTKQEQASEKADRFREYIQYPVLTNINTDYGDFDVYDVEPLNAPDVIAERPVILFGKYNGVPAGSIKIEGLSGKENFTTGLALNDYAPEENNSALRYLWARHKIRLLSNYHSVSRDDNLKEEITALGLKYNLLTEFTSFIAVDSIVRADSSDSETVNQPLPIPGGVSDNAIGDSYVPTGSLSLSNTNNEKENKSRIEKNYPNPFTGSTVLNIFIEEKDADAEKYIEIFNSLGQLIQRIDVTEHKEGWHQIALNIDSEIMNTSSIIIARLKIEEKYVSALKMEFINTVF